MKALPYLSLFFSLWLLTSCDQTQTNQTDREVALEQQEQSLQPVQQETRSLGADQQASGATDPALAPSRRLLDNIGATADLSTFAALLRTANLTQNLSGTGPYTVLAPTEAAFAAMPDSVRQLLNNPLNRGQLQDVLNNHIISGKLTTADLQDGAILKTAAGRQLKVRKRDGRVRIGNAQIEESDVMNSNGVLHTLNRVLVPEPES